MSEFILVLIVLCAGISAYAKARRAGTWSWPFFGKAILGISVLGIGAGALGVWLGRVMGPEHAIWITLYVLVVIGGGVVALTFWLRGKPGREKR